MKAFVVLRTHRNRSTNLQIRAPLPWLHQVIVYAVLFFAVPCSVHAQAPAAEASEIPPAERQEYALTVHEPMYFVVGGRDDTKARFQLSLKYRIFDPESPVVEFAPWMERFHFSYTQTSLWNWSADSQPFDDTSYRPSLFWEFGDMRNPSRTGFLRAGFEHESNGQAGELSRSIDTAFIMPGIMVRALGRDLLLAPKIYTYIDRARQNRDIADYRGYADFIVRYGNDDSWVLQALYRHGMGGHDSIQLDLSIPIRERIFARTGAYIYVQAFQGYGESMRDYDQREELSARIGIALVR